MGRNLDADDLPPDFESAEKSEFNDELPIDPETSHVKLQAQEIALQTKEEENAELLEGLRTMQGAEAIRWKIYRIKSENPDNDGYLEEVSTARLSMEYLRDEYGPGTYRVRGAYTAGGSYAGQRTVVVAKGAKQKVTDTNVSGAPGFDLQAFLAQQETRDRERRQEEEARREREEERREKERARRMELIATIAAPASAVIAAMFQNRGPDMGALLAALKPEPAPNMLDVVQALRAMKELDAPPAAVQQEDAIDKTVKLMEFLKDMGGMGGKTDGETGLWDIAKEIIKQIGPGAGQMLGAIGQAVQLKATLPAPAPASVPTSRAVRESDVARIAAPASTVPPSALLPPMSMPTSSASIPTPSMPSNALPTPSLTLSPRMSEKSSVALTNQEIERMGWLQLLPLAPHLPWLKGQVERLIVCAARGSDPELYAEVLLDELPAALDPQKMAALLASPDWFKMFSGLDARISQYPEFFDAVRQTILGMIQEATGVSAGVREHGGVDPATGHETIHIEGPGDAPETENKGDV